jgi:hypothetical protein
MKPKARKRAVSNRTIALPAAPPAKPVDHDYDVFLSHHFADQNLVTDRNDYIEDELNFEAYVDWKDSKSELDRSKASHETAAFLRNIMRHARSLIFVVTESTPASKWMPWELGFFDGRQSARRIGVYLPDELPSLPAGQEYLGIYRLLRKNDIEEFLRDAVLDVAALDSATSDQWLRHARRAALRPDDYWLSLVQWQFGYAANLLAGSRQDALMPDDQPADETTDARLGPWRAMLRRYQYAIADLRRQLDSMHRKRPVPETLWQFPVPAGEMLSGGPLYPGLPVPDWGRALIEAWLEQLGLNLFARPEAERSAPQPGSAMMTASQRVKK